MAHLMFPTYIKKNSWVILIAFILLPFGESAIALVAEQEVVKQPVLEVTYVDATSQGRDEARDKINNMIYDIYEVVAKEMGYELKLNYRPMKRIDEDFKNGLTAFVLSPDFQMQGIEGLYKTDPIFCYSYSLVSKKINPVRTVEEMEGKTIGYVLGKTFVEEYARRIEKNESEVNIIQLESDIEALKMLSFDRLDAAFITTLVYQNLSKTSLEDTHLAEDIKHNFIVRDDMEWVEARMFLHPSSVLYDRGDEFVEKVNALAKRGVFWKIFEQFSHYNAKRCPQ